MPTAAAAAVLAALVLGLPAAAATTRPILQLRGTAPLAVDGRGFASSELVRVVAVATAAQQTRTAIASKKGRLKIRFTLRLGRCADVTVRAVGSSGSRAVLRRAPACKRN